MLGGILPFLIQWLAVSHFGSVLLNPHPLPYRSSHPTASSSYSSYPSQDSYYMNQPPSQWKLLNDFATLSEVEIEKFLPQICYILLDYETMNDPRLIEHYERIIINKCANCLPFGVKVCNLLKAASQLPSEGLFRNLFPSTNHDQDRQDRLRNIQMKIEAATSYGINLPSKHSQLRCEYYRDMIFMMDSLARLGTELKSYPHAERNHHLRVALSQLNSLLSRRMITKANTNPPSSTYSQSRDHMSFSTESFYNSDVITSSDNHDMILSANTISASLDYRVNPYHSQPLQPYDAGFLYHPAQLNQHLPHAAKYSLHFPLQHCHDKVMKILRFVESECEVMPSRDRVPYLVIAELLEQPYECKSSELYTYEPMSPPPPPASITSSTTASIAGSSSIPHIASIYTATVPAITAEDIASGLPSIDSKLEVRGGSHSQSWEEQLQSQPSSYDSSQGYDGFGYQAQPRSHPIPYHPNHHLSRHHNRITFTRSQTWAEKKDMIRHTSPYGHLPGWNIKSFLVKSGDDLRKEMLAMQLIEYMQQIFRQEDVDVHLRPYKIMSTGYQAGLVEFLNGAKSIDHIKKSSSYQPSTLPDYFDFSFGPSYSLYHITAVENFVKSLAGYSLITYILQVKDRHNANLLIDPEGHIIHIDYGFILGDSPGFNLNFENAPFKLTKEYIDVMGGIDSYGFKMFEDLFVRGFFAIQKHIDGLITIIQLFHGDQRKGAVDALKARILYASSQADVISLIRDSLESWRTKQYDMFQQKSNNISM